MMKNFLVVLFFVCLTCLPWARLAAGEDENVAVRLRLIQADPGDGKTGIDPLLADISRELGALPFKAFVLLTEYELDLRPEVEDKTSLPEERTLFLRLKKITPDQKIQLQMRVEKPGKDKPETLLSTTLKLAKGSSYLTILQPPHKDKASTILAVTVKK